MGIATFKVFAVGSSLVEAATEFLSGRLPGARLSFEEFGDYTRMSVEHRRPAFSLSDMTVALGARVLPVSSAAAVVVDEPPTGVDYVYIVDRLIAEKVAEYGYDSIVSACSYSTSSVPKFRREGLAFSKWRDMIWTACFSLEEHAKATGHWPALEDVEQLLPSFEDILETAP